jgi:hypothetical protein
LGRDNDIFAEQVTTRIECSKYFAQHDDALRHPDRSTGDFFAAPISGSSGYTESSAGGRGCASPARERFVHGDPAVTDALMTIVACSPMTHRATPDGLRQGQPLGLVIVVILLIATFLLVWSMNNQPKTAQSFDPESPEPDQVPMTGTVGLPAEQKAEKPAIRSGAPERRGAERIAMSVGLTPSGRPPTHLRQHADNCHWRRWTPRRSRRPRLATYQSCCPSVPACHWCHVMAQSFEDARSPRR